MNATDQRVFADSRPQPSILLIDPCEPVRMAIKEILHVAGYQVTETGRVKDALRQIESTGANVVIMDLFLPDLDGFQAIEAVLSHSPATKIIAISGVADTGCGILADAQRLGASGTLSKPFRIWQLLETVHRALSN